MGMKILRRTKNIVYETIIERVVQQEPNKMVYPFVISEFIVTDYFSPIGKLVIPIKPNTDLSGSIFIQAETPNIQDNGTSYYSPIEIRIDRFLVGEDGQIYDSTDIYQQISVADDATKIIQIPVLLESNAVGTKNKLALIINARNLLPGKGYIENTDIGNIINLVYFEKKSQGE